MTEQFNEISVSLSEKSKKAAIRMTDLLSKQQMRQESPPLGNDELSPEEFLQRRDQIMGSQSEELITADEAVSMLAELAEHNPAVQAAHDSNIAQGLN